MKLDKLSEREADPPRLDLWLFRNFMLPFSLRTMHPRGRPDGIPSNTPECGLKMSYMPMPASETDLPCMMTRLPFARLCRLSVVCREMIP